MRNQNRFIVVDDDPMNNLVCKHIVLKFDKDAQIALFTEPEKALQVIADKFGDNQEGSGTIIFLDINMPVINGWEFLERFETFDEDIRRQISIYILSSSIDRDDFEKAERNKFVKGYYPKPLSIETMYLISNERIGFPASKQ